MAVGGMGGLGQMMRSQDRLARASRDRREESVDRMKERREECVREGWEYIPVEYDGPEYRPGWQKAGRIAALVALILASASPVLVALIQVRF